jgi:hypothetical protein
MEVIMDPSTLATTATAVALPYLADLGKEVAKSAAGGVGKTVWEWVKSKLTSPAGKEAVEDLEKNSEEGDNRRAVEAALSKFLKSDANALADLAKLLEQAGLIAAAQTANVVGDDNIIGQASGSGITFSINKGSSSSAKPSGGDVK